MADNLTITLDLSGFGAFLQAAEEAVALAVEAAAEAVVTDARERAPVSAAGSGGHEPGFMRDSTHYEMIAPNEAEVRADADYSLFVDEGHHTSTESMVPPQPWFTPAVEAERARFKERVAEALAEAGG